MGNNIDKSETPYIYGVNKSQNEKVINEHNNISNFR